MGNQSNSEKTIEEEKIQNIEQETKEKNEKEKIQKIFLNIKPLKIVILGDSKVGKTNFIRKSMNEPFQLEYTQTIGVEFMTFFYLFNQRKYKIQFWDTAGQKKYRNIIFEYCKGSNGFIFLYDITNRESFDNILDFIKIIKNCKSIILVGNVCDLKDQRKVSYMEGMNLGKQYNMNFFESSAKTGKNIKEIMNLLLKKILDEN